MLSKEKLENYESEWKNAAPFIDPKADVVAEYLQSPSDALIVEECPHGCKLKTHGNENDNKWISLDEDIYRCTKFCQEHVFARIYVTSGLDAAEANYSLSQ